MRALLVAVLLSGCVTAASRAADDREHKARMARLDALRAERARHLASRPPDIQEAIRAHRLVPGMVAADVFIALNVTMLCPINRVMDEQGRTVVRYLMRRRAEDCSFLRLNDPDNAGTVDMADGALLVANY